MSHRQVREGVPMESHPVVIRESRNREGLWAMRFERMFNRLDDVVAAVLSRQGDVVSEYVASVDVDDHK